MSYFSRSASIAGLVCAFILMTGLAAYAQAPWQYRQNVSWATGIESLDRWNGFYGGVQVGGTFSTVRTNEYITGTHIKTDTFLDASQSAFGGINIGYDWQVGQRWVVGVFTDFNGMHDQARHDFAGAFYIGARETYRGSVQARGGFLAFPNVLIYAKGGFAYGNEQLQMDFGGPETNVDKTITGTTFGAGFEVMLRPLSPNFGKATSVFFDYSHYCFDKVKLVMPPSVPGSDFTWHRETNAFEVGGRIRF